MKHKILIIVDMQNDFVNGSLGTKEAEAIVPLVCEKIKHAQAENTLVFVTKYTHSKNYLETREGRFLPVEHCIRDTEGWQINGSVAEALRNARVIEKYSFGSLILPEAIAEELEIREIAPKNAEIELVGLCTDICVISNAVLARTAQPETDVTVDASCCASNDPTLGQKALDVMESLQIRVIGR